MNAMIMQNCRTESRRGLLNVQENTEEQVDEAEEFYNNLDEEGLDTDYTEEGVGISRENRLSTKANMCCEAATDIGGVFVHSRAIKHKLQT